LSSIVRFSFWQLRGRPAVKYIRGRSEKVPRMGKKNRATRQSAQKVGHPNMPFTRKRACPSHYRADATPSPQLAMRS
jgi:hypothetical protein